jgi:hypothetical protein
MKSSTNNLPLKRERAREREIKRERERCMRACDE